MKTLSRILPLLALVLLLSAPCFAQDKATREEVMANVDQAVKMAQEKGLDETLKVLNDKSGPFVWKDSYVMAIDLDKGVVCAHPVTPALNGKNMMGIKDINGKMFFAEMVNIGKEKGEGWVDYMWPKPGDKTPSPKHSFLKVVPGTQVIFLAGVYD